jgi:hypothetical protein
VYTVFVVAASIFAGAISDRSGHHVALTVAAAIVQGVAALLIAALPGFETTLAAAALLGIGYGAYMSVGLALATDLLPFPDDSARDLGIVNVSAALGQLLGPVLGAGLVALVGGFWLLFVVGGALSIVGGLMTLAIGKRRGLQRPERVDACLGLHRCEGDVEQGVEHARAHRRDEVARARHDDEFGVRHLRHEQTLVHAQLVELTVDEPGGDLDPPERGEQVQDRQAPQRVVLRVIGIPAGPEVGPRLVGEGAIEHPLRDPGAAPGEAVEAAGERAVRRERRAAGSAVQEAPMNASTGGRSSCPTYAVQTSPPIECPTSSTWPPDAASRTAVSIVWSAPRG